MKQADKRCQNYFLTTMLLFLLLKANILVEFWLDVTHKFQQSLYDGLFVGVDLRLDLLNLSLRLLLHLLGKVVLGASVLLLLLLELNLSLLSIFFDFLCRFFLCLLQSLCLLCGDIMEMNGQPKTVGGDIRPEYSRN